jgi:AraC family transcriptional regulator, ethanolamine operon transcriptional activator
MSEKIVNVAAQRNPIAQRPADGHPAKIDGRLTWLDLATTDADDAAGIQREWMPIEYDQIDRGTFAGRFQQLGFQETFMAAERQNRTVLKRLHFPADYCTVSLIRTVSGQARCGLDALSNRSVGYMPGNKDYEVLLPPSEIVFFRIPQHRFLEASDTLGYRLPGHGRQMLFLDGLNPGYLDDMAETLMSIQHSPVSDLFAALDHGYLNQVVLERILGILLDSSAKSSRVPLVGAYRITRAAQALIESRDEEPLTIMTLCQELGVSRASLQRSFLNIYGVSPLAYLRMRRLNCARRALKAARGTGATVAAIAMNWGFFNFARFSRDYFLQFGELPSKTLGKSGRVKPATVTPFSGNSSTTC